MSFAGSPLGNGRERARDTLAGSLELQSTLRQAIVASGPVRPGTARRGRGVAAGDATHDAARLRCEGRSCGRWTSASPRSADENSGASRVPRRASELLHVPADGGGVSTVDAQCRARPVLQPACRLSPRIAPGAEAGPGGVLWPVERVASYPARTHCRPQARHGAFRSSSRRSPRSTRVPWAPCGGGSACHLQRRPGPQSPRSTFRGRPRRSQCARAAASLGVARAPFDAIIWGRVSNPRRPIPPPQPTPPRPPVRPLARLRPSAPPSASDLAATPSPQPPTARTTQPAASTSPARRPGPRPRFRPPPTDPPPGCAATRAASRRRAS